MFAVDRTAPVPLCTYAAAVRRALELRTRDASVMSYKTIAFVMGEYHGVHYSWQWWKLQLTNAGASPKYYGDPQTLPRVRAAALARSRSSRELEVVEHA